MAGEGGGEEIAALEVDVDDGVPFGPGHLGGRSLQRHAGIVDQHVDGAARAGGLRHRLRDAVLGPQIERQRNRLAAAQVRVRRDLPQPVRVEVGEREIEAGAAERQRGRPPEPGRGAGDQRGARFAHVVSSVAGGSAIQVRSAMLRWQASAKATSRMPAAKSEASGASLATWRRNASQPTR